MKIGQFAVFWRKGILEDTINPKVRKILSVEENSNLVHFETYEFPSIVTKSKIMAVFDDVQDAEDALKGALMGWKVQGAIVDTRHAAWLEAIEQRKTMIEAEIRRLSN